jgi:hypothetical protein
LVLAYNVKYVGNVIGAYALVSKTGLSHFLTDNALAGVAGLLFSPTHGLFVFSPFLLFVPFCLPSVFRDRIARGLTALVGGAAVLQLMLYGFGDWRQGVSWGPRWLTEMLPILFWMQPPILGRLSVAGRVAFGCLLRCDRDPGGGCLGTQAYPTRLSLLQMVRTRCGPPGTSATHRSSPS